MKKQEGKKKRKNFLKLRIAGLKKVRHWEAQSLFPLFSSAIFDFHKLFLVSTCSFNPVHDFSLPVSFCALHATFYFLGPRHLPMITVLLLTGTIILCYSHLALHYTFRSRLSKVITSSKNILFLVLSLLKIPYRHYLIYFSWKWVPWWQRGPKRYLSRFGGVCVPGTSKVSILSM